MNHNDLYAQGYAVAANIPRHGGWQRWRFKYEELSLPADAVPLKNLQGVYVAQWDAVKEAARKVANATAPTDPLRFVESRTGPTAYDPLQELALLQTFYRLWTALHALPNKTPDERRGKEHAAQMLVDQKIAIEGYLAGHPKNA